LIQLDVKEHTGVINEDSKGLVEATLAESFLGLGPINSSLGHLFLDSAEKSSHPFQDEGTLH